MDTPTPLPESIDPFAPSPAVPEKPKSKFVTLPITEKELGEWKARIDKSLEVQRRYHAWWDAALKAYAVQVDDPSAAYWTQVRTNKPFALVERKVADLAYKRGEVSVAPSALLDAMPQGASMAATHAAILNEKLGIDGIDAARLWTQAAFDYECFGAGWLKVGYRAYTTDITQPQVDVATGQPILDPMTGGPIMETVPVPVKSECFGKSLSVKQVLIPADCRSTQFDAEAAWMGWRFEMALTDAKRLYGPDVFPVEFAPTTREHETHFSHGRQQNVSSDTVSGTEIYLKSSLFREDVAHPDRMTQLVFIDGISDPVVYRDSPDQTVDPRGKLTPDSLIGFPFASLIVRVLTDSAYVMSDVVIGMPQTAELDKYREQAVRQRDINLLRGLVDIEKLTPEIAAQLKSIPQGGLVGVSSDMLVGDAIKWLEQPPIPPDDFRMSSILANDHEEAFGYSKTAMGAAEEHGETATTANLRQANVNVIIGKGQNTSGADYLRFVTKYSTILQRYLPVEDAAAIVGPEKAAEWDSWRKAIPTRLAFTMMPDAMLRNDTPQERKQLTDVYTFLANDSTLNRAYLNARLLERYHIDPTKAILPEEQIPKPKPEPGQFAAPVKVEDLNPLNPWFPIALDIFQQGTGLTVSPEAIEKAIALAAALQVDIASGAAAPPTPNRQPAHGGKAVPIESMSRHQVDATGAQQNTGALLPNMPMGPQ